MSKLETFMFVSLIGFSWLLSFFTHTPSVGFDDANITQAYAQNIANGHGYVYNIGGERVEGSTSLLWTAINILAFITPYPIVLLHVLSVLITSGVVLYSTRIAQELSDSNNIFYVNLTLFSFFPFFFGWGLFSLMDITLFILLIVYSIFTVIGNTKKKLSWVLVLTAFLLPLARPEGILVVLGIFIIWKLFYEDFERKILTGWSIVISGALSLAVATFCRLTYFGYPFPNTFYAKTSDDVIGQLIQGVQYLGKTAVIPQNFALLMMITLSITFFSNIKSAKIHKYIYAVSLLTLGAIVTYIYLGGDHFNGGRFYQFMIPLFLPIVSAYITRLIEPSLVGKINVMGWILATIVFAVFIVSSAAYYEFGGKFRHEFRIAEGGRKTASLVNDLLGNKYSVGVITAGGFRMGYDGIVYDVLGLNWTEMAHSTRSTDTTVLKNHGGFSEEVFFKALPEIFNPEMKGCDSSIKDGFFDSEFQLQLTKNVTQSQNFEKLYGIFCNEKMTFFGLRKYSGEFASNGFTELRV